MWVVSLPLFGGGNGRSDFEILPTVYIWKAVTRDLSEFLCTGRFWVVLFFLIQRAESEKNRSPNWMANCLAAAAQLTEPFFHFWVIFRKAR